MRKRITLITAITALAAGGLAPAAMAHPASPQEHKDNPTMASVQVGDRAGFDGFTAWQSGDVKVDSAHATIPITFNKDFSKARLPGKVGVLVVQDPHQVQYDKPVFWTNGDESYEAKIGYNPQYRLKPNTTYHYFVFIEYNFERFVGPDGSFTTGK